MEDVLPYLRAWVLSRRLVEKYYEVRPRIYNDEKGNKYINGKLER